MLLLYFALYYYTSVSKFSFPPTEHRVQVHYDGRVGGVQVEFSAWRLMVGVGKKQIQSENVFIYSRIVSESVFCNV